MANAEDEIASGPEVVHLLIARNGKRCMFISAKRHNFQPVSNSRGPDSNWDKKWTLKPKIKNSASYMVVRNSEIHFI